MNLTLNLRKGLKLLGMYRPGTVEKLGEMKRKGVSK